MGVNDLWSILSPVQESVSLYSLTGKMLAVDLSLWICEAQHVQGMMGRVTKPHLRNLFFRASSLLRMGIKLIFVMEGEAPKLKAETMRKRTETMFRPNKSKSAPKPATAKRTNTSRGRFMAVLRECAEMLDYLGLPWVAAVGEAEAMCAFMDAQGLVDGCITSDGDAFLYGAQTVYRNFNINTKDPQIECYKMSRVETELQLKRETLVGLAVLLGCDYIPKGVPGVGKEQTLKLIQNLNGQTLLQKFSDWGKTVYETQDFAVKKVTHCLVCRHPGSAKSHEQKGCVYCESNKFCQPQDYDYECPCDWHRTEHARHANSVEASIKKKTLACDLFPFSDIIDEYLISKDKAFATFKRRKPNLLLMQKFALEKMEWPKHYTSEKVLTLMTYTELMNRQQGIQSTIQMQPIRIYKRRIRNGVSCFEVLWMKPDHYVFPDDSPLDEQNVVRTVEEENLFNLAFPDIVDLYNKETSETKDNKLKKKKPKVEKEKLADTADEMSDIFAQMSLQSSSHLKLSSALPTIVDQPTSGYHASKLPKQPNNHDISNLPGSSLSQAVHQSEVPASRGITDACSQAQSSLSVSAVIDELQLSNIDWETLSFTAAPSPQNPQNKAGLKVVNKSNEKVKGEQCSLSVSGDLQNTKLPACLLKESKVFRNDIQVQSTVCELKKAEFSQTSSKPKNVKVSLSSQISGPNKHTYLTPALKEKVSEKRQQQKKSPPLVAPTKYKFVKVKHSNRQYSNAQATSKEISCKPSVCVRQGSSSDEENHPKTELRKNIKANYTKPPITQTVVSQLIEPDRFNIKLPKEISENVQQGSDITAQAHTPCIEISRTNPKTHSTVESGGESDDEDDDDDSYVSISSPLPLAERLKLNLLK